MHNPSKDEVPLDEPKDETLRAAPRKNPENLKRFLDLVQSKLQSEHGWMYASGGPNNPLSTIMVPPTIDDGQDNQLARSKKPEAQSLNKLTTVVEDRKSFGGLREKQGLRWIANITKAYLQATEKTEPEEVQVALDAENRLYVATNKDATNQALRELAQKHKNAGEMVQAMSLLVAKDLETWDSTGSRLERHVRKADERLLDTDIEQSESRYEDVIAGLGAKMNVVGKIPELDGWHAERRLEFEIGEDFDPTRLGGTMRPCFTCHSALYVPHGQGESQHAGPWWVAKNSNVDLGAVCGLKKEEAQELHDLLNQSQETGANEALDKALKPFVAKIASKLNAYAEEAGGLYLTKEPHLKKVKDTYRFDGTYELRKDKDTSSDSPSSSEAEYESDEVEQQPAKRRFGEQPLRRSSSALLDERDMECNDSEREGEPNAKRTKPVLTRKRE